MILQGTEALIRSMVIAERIRDGDRRAAQRVLIVETMEVVLRHRRHLCFSRAQHVRVQLLRG
jgi:hypothetical protein